MRCPKCRNPELDTLAFPDSDLELDRCPTCWGLWFDHGELPLALQARGQGIQTPPDAQKSGMRCPRCNADLFTFRYPHSDVTIDVCDICKGVWLDNGEFHRIRAWHQSLLHKDMEALDTAAGEAQDSLEQFLADVQTAMMPCPHCTEASLEELKLEYTGVTVDRCVRCGGVWFDGGELERVLNVAADDLSVPDTAAQAERLCPRCVEHLSTFEYPDTRVKVDMCRKCGGLWLDHGEFKRIRRIRSGEPEEATAGKDAASGSRANSVTRFFQKVVSRIGPAKGGDK